MRRLQNLWFAVVMLIVMTACATQPEAVQPPVITQEVEETTIAACPAKEGWTSVNVESEILEAALLRNGGLLTTGPDGRISRYTPGNSSKQQAISQQVYTDFDPSPDETMVAGLVNHELWLLNLDTGEEVSLGIRANGIVTWRPDSRAVFFVGPAEENYGIGELNLANREVRWWATTIPSLGQPDPSQGDVQSVAGFFDIPHASGSISSDGTRLLLSAGHSGNATIHQLDLVNNSLSVYPKTSGNGLRPRWYPDSPFAFFGWGTIAILNTDTGVITPADKAVPFQGRVADLTQGGKMLIWTSQSAPQGTVNCWMTGDAPSPKSE